MTIIAINSSPRKNSNSQVLIDTALNILEKEGFKTETINIGGKMIRGCLACGSCKKNQNMHCVIDNDPVNEIIQKFAKSKAIILCSPVYFADITAELKALIDRSGYVLRANGNPMERKPGAAIVVGRRAGHIHTFDSINHYFGIMNMFTIGSNYWNVAIAAAEGAVNEDKEGKLTVATMAENLAWLLKKIN